MSSKYPLPGGKGGISERFHELCQIQPVEYIPEIRRHMETVLSKLEKYRDDFLGPNINLAKEIVVKCNSLLDRYSGYSEDQRKLIIGAARYFIVHMDTMPDHTPVVGLEDDLLVTNHVLERLGLSAECI